MKARGARTRLQLQDGAGSARGVRRGRRHTRAGWTGAGSSSGGQEWELGLVQLREEQIIHLSRQTPAAAIKESGLGLGKS